MRADRSGTIKGLYAAGNCLGQRYGVGYSTPSAGNSIGMAMTHGRVAGKIMAACGRSDKYVRRNNVSNRKKNIDRRQFLRARESVL